MTKAELREKLLGGAIMDDLFAFRNGQDVKSSRLLDLDRVMTSSTFPTSL